MKTKSIIAALLLLVAGLQPSWAQERGIKIWRDGHFKGYVVSEVDSIQFVILATDIVLSQTEVALEIGDSVKLTATIYPEDASKILGWSSSNPEIASVSDEGVVTGQANGTCTITCTAVDGRKVFSECMVQVGKEAELEGDGTLASPYNVAAILALINEMEPGVESTEEYYIKGKVLNIKTNMETFAQYGDHTFEMVDEGYNFSVFTAYQVYGPGRMKFTSADAIQVGDEVVVCGKVVNYRGNTPETVGKGAAYVVSINGSGSDNALTCDEAVQLTNALVDGGYSTETYSVTGYITEVVSNVSRNQQTFWMADTKDGGQVFEAYWANLPEGVTEFKAGMKVTITGQLLKYVKDGNVTPEIKNADVVILEDGGGQGGDIQHISIAEFLARADANTTYELTGVVRNISNTTYGNFDLVENGDSIYIYGLLDQDGAARQFESLGIEEGDIVTLTGTYTVYNEMPEIKNAQFVSLVKGDGGGQGGDDTDPSEGFVNGGFEEWVSDTEPVGWKSASTASSAELAKSDEARSGNSSCLIVAGGTMNKRLATQEITLEAGTYTFSFYAKSTTDDVCQTRAGYVPVTDGAVGSYKYGSFVNLTNSEWTLVTYDIELTEETTLCLIVMNPKDSSYSVSQGILVDDASLVKK